MTEDLAGAGVDRRIGHQLLDGGFHRGKAPFAVLRRALVRWGLVVECGTRIRFAGLPLEEVRRLVFEDAHQVVAEVTFLVGRTVVVGQHPRQRGHRLLNGVIRLHRRETRLQEAAHRLLVNTIELRPACAGRVACEILQQGNGRCGNLRHGKIIPFHERGWYIGEGGWT